MNLFTLNFRTFRAAIFPNFHQLNKVQMQIHNSSSNQEQCVLNASQWSIFLLVARPTICSECSVICFILITMVSPWLQLLTTCAQKCFSSNIVDDLSLKMFLLYFKHLCMIRKHFFFVHKDYLVWSWWNF